MGNRLTRPLLDRILPDPGEGPDEKARRNGRFRLQIRALTSTGARYTATVAASGDPGYAATSVMLSQAALCLAIDDLPAGGGVLTPATAMNGALTGRLRENGFTFAVRRDRPEPVGPATPLGPGASGGRARESPPCRRRCSRFDRTAFDRNVRSNGRYRCCRWSRREPVGLHLLT